MGPAIALVAALISAQPCAEARRHYELLELDDALSAAESAIDGVAHPALACLEVKALTLTLQGRLEEAERVFRQLFGEAPDYKVSDPSLPPATTGRIESIREAVRPLEATVVARWLIHESIRIDVALEGGLRDASFIRYRSTPEPEGESVTGEIRLIGRAATATVSVKPGTDVRSLKMSGQVLNDNGRILHQFSSELLLLNRPPMREPEGSDILDLWPVWVGAAVVVVAAATTVVILAQPTLPDANGTLGRAPVSP